MTQLVTIQQAARNALATWLTSELAAVTGGVVVESRWFENDRPLPAKAISIIDAGPREIEWMQPEILATTNVNTELSLPVKKVDATWNLGQIEQRVQLDVWARTEPELTDIMARLDASLNKGERGLGSTNADLFRPGLLLNLGNGWAPGIADVLFEGPLQQPSPESIGAGEFRASYRGRASAQLVQVARSARIARILIEQRLRESDPIDTADSPVTITIDINS